MTASRLATIRRLLRTLLQPSIQPTQTASWIGTLCVHAADQDPSPPRPRPAPTRVRRAS